MKKLLAAMLALTLALGLCACGAGTGGEAGLASSAVSASGAGQASSMPPPDSGADAAAPEETVRRYLQLLIDGDYEAANTLHSQEMTTQLGAMGGTAAFVQTLYAQMGTFERLANVENLGAYDGYVIIVAGVVTDQGELRLQIPIDADGRVAGIQVLPSAEAPIPPPEGFVEEAVTVDAGGGYPLEGRLVKPEAPGEDVPLVVLVQGSGASGYDEVVGANRVFGKLAHGLAQRGIATLRYDKRNYAYPEIMAAPDYTIHDEYVQDVLAAVALAGEQDGIDADRVYILGHSQGGMLAPLFLAEGAGAAGMILLAGTPRSLLDVMDDQQAELVAYYEAAGMDALAEEYRAIQVQSQAERAALDGMTADGAKAAGTVYGMGAYYVYTLEAYDAIAEIKALRAPTLILQGGADRQVYADVDYRLYQNALEGEDYVAFGLYEALNHLFLPSAATNIVEAMAEYYVQGDIPAEVFDDIAAWLAAAA